MADSRRVIDGEKIGNPAVREAMTSDGSSLSDWGEYTTRTRQPFYSDFEVHYYYNPGIGRPLNYDYKAIMNRKQFSMRVRMTTEFTVEPAALQGISALMEGREYPVLEVSAPFKRPLTFRVEFIEAGLRQSGLFDSRIFTVTSNSLPPNWKYFQFESGSFSLCPEPWNASGFWEAYYEGDPHALAVYEKERAATLLHS
ncbi:hypothetical protein ABTX86_25585 [Streptomyces anulatus]|uniref:hypothetical protein n=1 Tax=Streptomyces anulatus TaxID=1892 RepID=UPI00331776C4